MPADVVRALKEIVKREGFAVPRIVRVFIALLVERYAQEIGRPEVRGIAEDVLRRGAHRMLRQALEPLVG